MPETQNITLTHKEVVEALIKHQGLHEGIWQLYIEFGIAAANVPTGEDQILPAAIVPVKTIGLYKTEQESPLSVDAAKVNPK